MDKYYVMYSGYYAGVAKTVGDLIQWVVEPEFSSEMAKDMAAKLNANPDISIDELYESTGVGKDG